MWLCTLPCAAEIDSSHRCAESGAAVCPVDAQQSGIQLHHQLLPHPQQCKLAEDKPPTPIPAAPHHTTLVQRPSSHNQHGCTATPHVQHDTAQRQTAQHTVMQQPCTPAAKAQSRGPLQCVSAPPHPKRIRRVTHANPVSSLSSIVARDFPSASTDVRDSREASCHKASRTPVQAIAGAAKEQATEDSRVEQFLEPMQTALAAPQPVLETCRGVRARGASTAGLAHEVSCPI